jgi:hypothetical protein
MRAFRHTSLPALVVLLLLAAVGASAQKRPVSWSLKLKHSAKRLRRGESFDAQLVAIVVDGWRLYALQQPRGGPPQLQLVIPNDQPFTLDGNTRVPAPRVKFDRNFGKSTYCYDNVVTFTLPITISPKAQ